MALFQTAFSGNGFNIRGVTAGDAAEMESRLTNEIAAAVIAGETGMVEFQVAGAGAGLNWEAWFVSSAVATSGARLPYNSIDVAAAEAGNPVEALLKLNQKIASFGVDFVYKVVIAGAGVGPTYMAIAVVTLD